MSYNVFFYQEQTFIYMELKLQMKDEKSIPKFTNFDKKKNKKNKKEQEKPSPKYWEMYIVRIPQETTQKRLLELVYQNGAKGIFLPFLS